MLLTWNFSYSKLLLGTIAITSSIYLLHNLIVHGAESSIYCSICYIVNSATATEIGEPIGVPLCCLYNYPFHLKKLELIHSSSNLIISSLFRLVLDVMSLSASIASLTFWSAKSNGILVNRLLTSNDMRTSSLAIVKAYSCCLMSHVSFILHVDFSVIGVNNLDRKCAAAYVGESIKETMGRIGLFSLCILIVA